LRFLLQAVVAGFGFASVPRASMIAFAYRKRYFAVQMRGASMLPTFRNGDVLRIETTAYRRSPPRRGDIVVFQLPVPRPHVPFLVKRVIALPGEVVFVQDGSVHINGHRLKEHYVRNQAEYYFPPHRISAGSYVLLGDNRNNSEDSHLLGPVPLRDIAGKVVSH
jgi:signal peptidase I